jgi:tetratricopeptide (TPR) repeat protein
VQMMSRMTAGFGCVLLLLTVAVGCSKDPAVARQEYFDSATRLMAEKKYNDAIVQLRNALKADPKFGEARLKLAEAYAETGDTRRAVQEYVRAADLLPGSADAQIKAGNIMLLGGRFEDAKSRAEKALAADPKSLDARILLGNATAGSKDIDGALKELEEAVALSPTESRGYTALGAIQLAKGDREVAEATFRKAVEVQPNAVPARLALANFLWSTNRRDEAVAELQAAAKLEPSNKLVNRALATFNLATGNAAAAEPYLKVLASDPKDVAAQVALGDYYLRLERVKEARDIYTAVSKQKDGFEPGQLKLAGIAFGERNPTEAFRLIDEVLKQNPKSVEALLVKSRIQRAEGKAKEALVSATAATTAQPESVAALYERGLVELDLNMLAEGVKSLREAVRLNPKAAAIHLQLANALLRQREYPAALVAAEDALRNAPQDPTAHLMVARTQMASGDLQAAAATMVPLQKQFPDVAIVWSQLGSLRLLQRDAAGARQAFERALQLQPGQIDGVEGLAVLDVGERKPEQAVARMEALVAKEPDNVRYLQIASRSYMAVRSFDKAEAALRRVLELDNNNLETYGLLGQLYLMQNKTEQALKEYEALSRQQPTAVGPHTVAAMLLQSMNRLDEAQKRYERVIEIDREAPVAANNLAWLYAERGGNIDVALQLAQTARRRLPNEPAVADTLGWIYVKKQQYPQAIRELADAVAKEPENPEYQYHLGEAYRGSGDVAKARAALQKAVARPFAGTDAARKALAALPATGD